MSLQWGSVDPTGLRALLLDADGNLFPSEEPAFVASADVTNAFLAELGVDMRYTPEELRLATTGRNFRTTAVDLCVEHGVAVDPARLEHWVAEEKRRVGAHLGRVLRPDPDVLDPLGKLAPDFLFAAVSSSASARLDTCFQATGLATLIRPDRRFSAEDSLPVPTSKPDPAIYVYALERVGCFAWEALAVEDSVPGARSAVAAGIATVGNVVFVPAGERAARTRDLLDAGVCAVVDSWWALVDALGRST